MSFSVLHSNTAQITQCFHNVIGALQCCHYITDILWEHYVLAVKYINKRYMVYQWPQYNYTSVHMHILKYLVPCSTYNYTLDPLALYIITNDKYLLTSLLHSYNICLQIIKLLRDLTYLLCPLYMLVIEVKVTVNVKLNSLLISDSVLNDL